MEFFVLRQGNRKNNRQVWQIVVVTSSQVLSLRLIWSTDMYLSRLPSTRYGIRRLASPWLVALWADSSLLVMKTDTRSGIFLSFVRRHVVLSQWPFLIQCQIGVVPLKCLNANERKSKQSMLRRAWKKGRQCLFFTFHAHKQCWEKENLLYYMIFGCIKVSSK